MDLVAGLNNQETKQSGYALRNSAEVEQGCSDSAETCTKAGCDEGASEWKRDGVHQRERSS